MLFSFYCGILVFDAFIRDKKGLPSSQKFAIAGKPIISGIHNHGEDPYLSRYHAKFAAVSTDWQLPLTNQAGAVSTSIEVHDISSKLFLNLAVRGVLDVGQAPVSGKVFLSYRLI